MTMTTVFLMVLALALLVLVASGLGIVGYARGATGSRMTPAKATATVIELGDMLFRDTGASDAPKPASDYTWDTDLATTQTSFHDLFLGCSLGRGKSGSTDPVLHASSGRFRFRCASATFKVGDLVGPAKQTGNALERDKVVSVATVALAIGRVSTAGASITEVEVEIEGTMVTGGTRAFA